MIHITTDRNGDIARIEDGSTSQRTASKSTKKGTLSREITSSLEGVVYKVNSFEIYQAPNIFYLGYRYTNNPGCDSIEYVGCGRD